MRYAHSHILYRMCLKYGHGLMSCSQLRFLCGWCLNRGLHPKHDFTLTSVVWQVPKRLPVSNKLFTVTLIVAGALALACTSSAIHIGILCVAGVITATCT